MKLIILNKAPHFPKSAKYFALCLLATIFSFKRAEAQNKNTRGGSQSPNTEDIRTISQSGDNKAFPSGRNSSSQNNTIDKSLNVKKAIKQKQGISSKFRGNDVHIKNPNHVNPKVERERGGNTNATDHSNYADQREDNMKTKEKPHDKHDFQGNDMVNPKFIKFGAPLNVNHINQESPIVDHSKFQEYRKKNLEKHEKTMTHLNSEGAAQYGRRPSIDKSMNKKKAIKRKQEMSSKFRGNDTRTKNPYHVNPKVECTRGGNTIAPNHSNYAEQRKDNMKMKEKPHDKHNFQGNDMVNPKFIKFGAPLNVNHINQKSPLVDYSKFQEYRKKAFKKHEKNMIKQSSQGSAQYGKRPSGDFLDLNGRRALRSSKDKEQFSYEGDIALNEKNEIRREKEKEISTNSGDILVKTLRERDNRIRIKAKKIANWEGDVILTKKIKGTHPSAAYAGGKIANSYKEKEKYRRQMLRKYGRNPDLETPSYERKKQEKPTYDKNEGKIWDVQNYQETKIKDAP